MHGNVRGGRAVLADARFGCPRIPAGAVRIAAGTLAHRDGGGCHLGGGGMGVSRHLALNEGDRFRSAHFTSTKK